MNKKLKIKTGFSLRRVGDNAIVVPMGAQTVNFRCVITLNDTGCFLWEQLQTQQTVDALVEALLSEYEVTAEQAKVDVSHFLDELRQAELLE